MRISTSFDYFIRTPANTIAVRSRLSVNNETVQAATVCALDVRINQENYTRGIAIHVPSNDADLVAKVVGMLVPQLNNFAGLQSGGGEIVIGQAPDVRIGAGFQFDNRGLLEISAAAPWLKAPINICEFALSKFIFVFCDCYEHAADLGSVKDIARQQGFEIIVLGETYLANMKNEKPAYFISYDARNKAMIAEPLAAKLASKGEPVWFDAFTLRPGFNLREALDDGLRACEHCVLLISRDFLANEAWAKVEFDSIFSREVAEKRNIIIPIWIDVNRRDVDAFSLALGNKVAILTTTSELATDEGLERVAHAVTTARASGRS